MPNLPRKNTDPYRELGVPRGASESEIKKAHRSLAKRFHPDASGGDTVRFLAVQEAYSLLSDPLRRREWDARHSPSPVRANEPRKPRPRGSDGRWTREEGTPSATRQRTASARRQRPPEPARDSDTDGSAREATWSGSDRPSGTRSYRWSAENVPWWEDFAPRNSAGSKPANQPRTGKSQGPAAASSHKSTGHEPPRPTAGPSRQPSGPPPAAPNGPANGSQGQQGNEFDVYSRSSGAAWSSAARQYFRKASEDLPSRGSFVYRGTQVVTGATARKVAEDLLRQRPGVGAAPRQAFESRDQPAHEATRPASRASRTAAPPWPGMGTSVPGADTGGVSARPTYWTRPEPAATEDARSGKPPGVLATAAVGGVGGLAVTLPLLALGMIVLNPPLQPAFAGLLLVLAAIAGALAAMVWVRLRTTE